MNIITSDRIYYATRGIAIRVAVSVAAILGVFAMLIGAVLSCTDLIGW